MNDKQVAFLCGIGTILLFPALPIIALALGVVGFLSLKPKGGAIMQIELTLPLPPPEWIERMEREQQPEIQNDPMVDFDIDDGVTFDL